MSANDLILLILVAGGAFYAGYQVGRFKALAEAGTTRRQPDDDQPLPGRRLDQDSAAPSRPRGAPPPPASAGGDSGAWQEAGGSSTSGRTPPRRSSRPPPAAAGLMGTGEAEKSGKRQK